MIQDTGMRPEEVFGIRIESINWTRRFDLPITNYPADPTAAMAKSIAAKEFNFKCSL